MSATAPTAPLPSLPRRLPRLALPEGSLLVGDLHLDLERADQVAGLAAWLDGLDGVPALVLLGDLFEYWIGPAHAATEGGRAVLAALRRLADRDCAVSLVPGNRDFLVDAAFERASGAAVLPRGALADVAGEPRPVLIVHGDELCTLDRGYRRLRAVLRSGPLSWLAPRLPAGVARAVARRLRRASTRAVDAKPSARVAQQPSAVAALLGAAGAGTLVCGHAHRFRDERVGESGRWLVVDAFGGERDGLRVGADGLEPVAAPGVPPPWSPGG